MCTFRTGILINNSISTLLQRVFHPQIKESVELHTGARPKSQAFVLNVYLHFAGD